MFVYRSRNVVFFQHMLLCISVYFLEYSLMFAVNCKEEYKPGMHRISTNIHQNSFASQQPYLAMKFFDVQLICLLNHWLRFLVVAFQANLIIMEFCQHSSTGSLQKNSKPAKGAVQTLSLNSALLTANTLFLLNLCHSVEVM